jgi:hypothetical protein
MGKVTIEGKRFSKIRKEVISPSEFGTVFKAGKNGISVFERLDKFIEFGSKMMEQEPKSDEQDSYYNLGQRLHFQALVARNEKNSIEGRLEAAIELGIIYQVIKTYKIESQTNKDNGANPRICSPLDNFVMDLVNKGKTYHQIWNALPIFDEADDFYKDGDKLYSKNEKGNELRHITKTQFIKKKVLEIKKRYKNTTL